VLGLQSAARKYDLAVNVGIHVPAPVQAFGSVTNTMAAPAPAMPERAGVPGSCPQGPSPKGPGHDRGAAHPKLFNRTIWINPDGSLLDCGTYDKVHLFDYANLQESAHTQAGTAIVKPFDTPVGRVGSLICFDVRFPEPSLKLGHPPPALVARGFRPAQIITYPSAFTVPTGRAHWEVLLRARAIESQTWVIAAAQVGPHNEKRTSYGHSMAVDPWGRVVCRLGGIGDDGTVDEGAVEALGLVDVNLDEWERVRRQMPLVRRT